MSTHLHYEELAMAFSTGGTGAGLDALIAALRAGNDHHALFRALLLKKRHELGLPLLNPADLRGCPDSARAEYKAFVDSVCREVGARALGDGDIAQAWRYYGALGDAAPVRAALENLEPQQASDEVLAAALAQGVHPQRGFQLTLERHGLDRALRLFETGFSPAFQDKQYAAALLVRTLYKELVRGVCKAVLEKTGQLPGETDLVELVRGRTWLFEGAKVHADAQAVIAISRIGLLCEAREDLIMSLCISEYGRLLETPHHPPSLPLFEAGYQDHARFARALLGESADETVDYFRNKLYTYHGSSDTFPAEMVMLLYWRLGRKDDALDIWQQHLSWQPPEKPGAVVPSFYELCLEAQDFSRLSDIARTQDDVAAWAAAQIMESRAADSAAPVPLSADSASVPLSAGNAPPPPASLPAPTSDAGQDLS